jgi:hypothetical protein
MASEFSDDIAHAFRCPSALGCSSDSRRRCGFGEAQLVSHEVIINLIAHTATKTGLKIRAALDRGRYPTGVAIAADELAAVNLKRADFHGDWNYAIFPTRKKI